MNNETLLKKLIKIRDGNITLLDEVISDLKLEFNVICYKNTLLNTKKAWDFL